jgi:hypothetical protein
MGTQPPMLREGRISFMNGSRDMGEWRMANRGMAGLHSPLAIRHSRVYA